MPVPSPLWYVYPMWHRVSFSVIAQKHIQQLKKKIRVHEVDELAFPHITPHCKPIVFIHPLFFTMIRASKFIARKLHLYGALVGIDVADSDHISGLAVSITNYTRAVIVPSTYAKKVYVKSGVTVPIHVVPHGVDKEWYTRQPRITYFRDIHEFKKKHGLKYILFFLWHSPWRKGSDLVYEFYRRLKKERKDVTIIFKTQTADGEWVKKFRSLGCIHVYGWLTEEQKIELYDLADIYPLFSRGGGFECVPPDTIIVTKNGVKEIKDVRVGDEVLTHSGEFKRVVRTFKRWYKGEIIKLIPYGFENVAIRLTPEHPVLVLPSSKLKIRKRKYVIKEQPVWKQADEVKPGDAVLVPIPRVPERELVFDLAEYIKDDIEAGLATADNKHVWYTKTGSPRFTQLSYHDIERLTGESKKIVCEAIRCYLTGMCPNSERVRKVVEFLKGIGYRPEYVKVRRFVKLGKSLAKVIGYYLAEGSINESNWAIEFSFGDEPELVEDLVKAIIDTFEYVPSVIKYRDKKATKVIICNKAIAKFLLKLCGKGAGKKRFPFELMMVSKDILSWALWSAILGDGCVDDKRIRYATKSRGLAFGMYIALVSLGYKPRILYHRILDQWHVELSIPPDTRGSVKVKSPKNNPLRPRVTDYIMHSNKMFMDHSRGFMIILVRKVEREKYDGYVYNLEVEEDNTYTANMVIVHNCNGLEALSRGTIVLAADKGSWVDYMPEWGLVDSRPCPYVLKDNPLHDGRGHEVIVEKAVDKAHHILDNLDDYKAKVMEHARKKLMPVFNWETVGKQLLNIYMSIRESVRR